MKKSKNGKVLRNRKRLQPKDALLPFQHLLVDSYLSQL